MKCDLKIESLYSGENCEIKGTITVDGEQLTIDANGSASLRGTIATVTRCDGSKSEVWLADCESLESAVDEAFAEAYDAIDKHPSIDVDLNWRCDLVDGQVHNPQQIEPD